MDERRMTNEQRERERRRKAAAARKAAARYEDPGVGYQRRRRAKKRRRRVRNVCIALLVIFIVVIGLAGGTIYWIKYGPTKETYDLNKYFGITAKSQMGVTINNEVLDAQAITEGGTAYLSYNFVQDYISDRFYWDSNEHILLYTLPRDMVKAAADSKDYSVSDTVNSEDYTIVKTEGDTAYIALDFLQKYANFDYEVYKDPARVVITSKFGERQMAKVKDDSQVRILGGVKSPVLEEVKKGDKLAGTRIIPLVIEREKMEQAKAVCEGEPILELKPFVHKKVGIVTTGNEVYYHRIEDTFTPVIKEKLAEYDTEVIGQKICNDDHEKITKAILSFIERGADLVLCTGGMSVDPDDKTPLAIKNTGAEIVSYGAPVLPGAMFLLSYYNGNIPIIGLPGCVMYAKRTIFDLALPRIMADDEISVEELAALGEGGLCLNCPVCTFPNCGFGK